MDRSPLRRVLVFAVAMSLAGTTLHASGATELSTATWPTPLPQARAGELLVQAGRHASGLERALDRAGARAVAAIGGGLSLVRVPAGQERAAAQRLTADPAVVYAEPNYVRVATSHDPAEIGWGVRSTRAPELWERPTPVVGAGVRVAILDSGVDATHPQLRGRVARRFDAYGGNGADDCGHGTAVAGVVAAAHDGAGPVGVAPDATIVPVRVLRFDDNFGVCGGDDAAIIRGIRWAADPLKGAADIINMSLSGPQRSRALRDAVAYAISQGVLVVAASGNSGDRTVHFPAAYPGVLSVGGIQRGARDDYRFWPHTSFGSVDIAAPAKGVRVLLADAVREDPWRIGQRCGDAPGWCADGTSFAAPHIAGVAALLGAEHGELETMSPRGRLRRLRQWVLATAPRVDGRPGGVDLRTGHGRLDAVRAVDVSTDPSAVLLSWDAGRRVLAPTRRMAAPPAHLRMKLVATTGTGAPLAGQDVDFVPPARSSVGDERKRTNSSGIAPTTLRSDANGRLARLHASVAGRSLPIDTYVLHRDDNVPGVRAPRTAFRGLLNLATDTDDVYRFHLRKAETLRALVTELERPEQVMLFLHRGTTRDVTDPYLAPLEEDEGFGDPRRLSRAVSSDGVRYLDVFGFGTYRLRWRILSPGSVRHLAASPPVISPDGDGRADATALSWRVARKGRVTVRIRNAAGTIVRDVSLGRLEQGRHAYRWQGRNDAGRVVRDGHYRASLRWANGRGRTWTEATRITVRR